MTEQSTKREPMRWYVMPGSSDMLTTRIRGYLYEPREDKPHIWKPVRALTPEERAVEDAEYASGWRRARTPVDPGLTGLYRLHNSAGHLLYVGISGEPPRRWVEHSDEKPWWPEVANLSLEWFDTRAEALDAEIIAICRERPKYNIQHNAANVA